MRKFEYFTSQKDLKDKDLNSYGQEGWELISHSTATNNFGFIQYYVFKREIL